jgi:hypothetical protein
MVVMHQNKTIATAAIAFDSSLVAAVIAVARVVAPGRGRARRERYRRGRYNGALQGGLVGSLNLLRLGWLSLRAPRILVVGNQSTIMKSITGRSDGSARLFLVRRERPAWYGEPQVQSKRNEKASGSVTRYWYEILMTLPPNALRGTSMDIGSAGTRVQENKKKSPAPHIAGEPQLFLLTHAAWLGRYGLEAGRPRAGPTGPVHRVVGSRGRL